MNTIHEDCFLFKGNKSKNLVIYFSCWNPTRKETRNFDAYFLTKQEDFDVLLARDLNNSWYQRPLDEENESGNLFLDYIESFIKGYDRVITIGSSMGAYASILFGVYLDVDLSIAFSPQITLDTDYLDTLKDRRYRDDIARGKEFLISEKFINITDIHPKKTKVNVYFGENDPQDQIFSKILLESTDFSIINVKYLNHWMVDWLHLSGCLKEIINQSIITNDQYDPNEHIEEYRKIFNHTISIGKDGAKVYYPLGKTHVLKHILINISTNIEFKENFSGSFRPKMYIRVWNTEKLDQRLRDFYCIPEILLNEYLFDTLNLVDCTEYPHGSYCIEVALSAGDNALNGIGYEAIHIPFRVDNENIMIFPPE